jgi:hypothetical protein
MSFVCGPRYGSGPGTPSELARVVGPLGGTLSDTYDPTQEWYQAK